METSPLAILFVLFLVGLLVFTVSGTLRRKNVITPEQEKNPALVGFFIAVLAAGLLFGAMMP